MLLVCSGLDHAHRGYESFARECFQALRDEPGVSIGLVKGSGSDALRERAIPTLRRDRPLARALGAAIGRFADGRPFRIEAFVFGVTLQPLLLARRPDVVYVSEWDTARVLARIRALTRMRFKLLFCNGGFASDGFDRFDHIQELTPGGRDYVLTRGADPAKHTVLPMGIAIERELPIDSAARRASLRARLGLPRERTILVSVAALNRTQKRLDYLIDELASLPQPRPFLLLDGQAEEETASLRQLADQRLGPGEYEIRTSPSAQLPDVLRACDVFVLASLAETQARALIEAMGQGLPCIAHDSPVTRFALGDHGFFGDFVVPGAITLALAEYESSSAEELSARVRAGHAHVYERFSWERLRPRYVEFLAGVANSTVSSSSGENVSRYSA